MLTYIATSNYLFIYNLINNLRPNLCMNDEIETNKAMIPQYHDFPMSLYIQVDFYHYNSYHHLSAQNINKLTI